MPPSEQDERPGSVPRPLSGGAAGRPVAEELRFVLGAEWVAPSIARDRFDRWLSELSWPSGQREDLVLALSEAVSNSVEHGYRIDRSAPAQDLKAGTIEVQARLLVEAHGVRRIALTVRDHGSWREPAAAAFRGHGLGMIRSCADEFRIDAGAAGTTLTLTSRPAPSGPAPS